MREDQLRKVVETVVRLLADRGLLREDCGCGHPGRSFGAPVGPLPAPARVTIGTAGKVFSEDRPGRPGPKAPPRPEPAPGGGEREEADHTASPGCPHCDPLDKCSGSELRAIGADRIAVCHPTKNCSSIARLLDHTLLKPNATQEEVAQLCAQARQYCFASVCVNPSYVAFCARLLAGSGVRVCTVIGFPLGSTTSTVKAVEARDAIANGADEIDMVLNVGALKSGNDAAVFDDIRAVREATRGKVLKVILETALLAREEKVRACLSAKKAGADFVKTSTGFGPGGATVDDIRLMRETVGPLMGVKASGGIRDTATAQAMILAGATRLGTSASVAIVATLEGEPAAERKY